MPLILLERLCGGGGKIMVAQPRRIAAYGLYERARTSGLEGVVGLRMGNNTRLESASTRLWCAAPIFPENLGSSPRINS